MPDDPTDQTADRPARAAVKAPAKKAPAKKAAAKKAPAKKAPAKKAPAKKAPEHAKRIAARMQVLEDRLAAGPAVVEASTTTTLSPSPPPYSEDRSDALPERAEVAGTDDRSREVTKERKRGRGTAVLIVVLLLAVAAGLGTAAIVKNRTPVWQSHATVRLLPGTASSVSEALALRDGQRRYVEKVRNASFTGAAALTAGMPDSEVTKTVTATPGKDGTLVLDVDATTRRGAIALANASAITLVSTVASDQKVAAAAPGDRLGATPVGTATAATRTTPSDTSIALAGVLAAVGVLLVAGGLIALGRAKK